MKPSVIVDEKQAPMFQHLEGFRVAETEDGEPNCLLIKGFADDAEVMEFCKRLSAIGLLRIFPGDA